TPRAASAGRPIASAGRRRRGWPTGSRTRSRGSSGWRPPAASMKPERPATLSVAIIALNEEERIRACLESVPWAEEIVVVDSGSSDKPVAIAREFTDRVVFHAWEGYGAQKNFALAQCRSEGILALDPDEGVSEALHGEIARTLAAPAHAGYLVPRQNFFQGAWVRHGGWYPDHQLRLFRRGAGAFTASAVHESARVAGSVGRLQAALVHQS